MTSPRLALVATLSLLFAHGAVVPGSVAAQPALPATAGGPGSEVTPASPSTFGTATEVAHTVAAAEFAAFNSADTWHFASALDSTSGRLVRVAEAQTAWWAGLRLPAGAVVTRLEVAACDTASGAELLFALYRSRVPPGTGLDRVTPEQGTGGPDTPGCGRFSVTPSSPLVIDNAGATYWIGLRTDLDVVFDSARVFYRLQVSPAPATATFGDVPPSHPFFQFVEALAASGITAGCGGGSYCPDDPVTRSQMAVFLGKGLGLHFAP